MLTEEASGEGLELNHQKVVLFSGGRTSGYMLRKLIDADKNFNGNYLVCFANTGKERDETLDFVNDVSINWGIDIKWLEYRFIDAKDIPPVFPTERRNSNLKKKAEAGEKWHWFEEVNYKTASRNGRPFDHVISFGKALPNVVSRYCTTQMKIRTVMRYLFSIGIHEFHPHIGIRKDEESRKVNILAYCEKNEHPEFPLIDLNVAEKDVLNFWKQQGFDLKLQSYEGNCDMCFLKAKHKLVRIAQEKPHLVDWWKEHERKKLMDTGVTTGSRFRLNEPFEYIEYLATQDDLFFKKTEDVACNCLESGFNRRGDDDL